MSKSILEKAVKTLEGFQYSVNIAYDLDDIAKIKDFIPTVALVELLESIFLSTYYINSNQRARILVGPYGKGKSHLILVLLALLSKKDLSIFEDLLKEIAEYNQEFAAFLRGYIESEKRFLPVIVQGSYHDLSQALLLALQNALRREGLNDIVLKTNYSAALEMIEKWRTEYPETYQKFLEDIGESAAEFIRRLSVFDKKAYKQFVDIYPSLTAGSIFNPPLGFDVIDVYEEVGEQLISYGYEGIYIVYDEFGKYLEDNISRISAEEMKLLQDLAEKCNRSRENQLHLLLITHKDIANYIDKLPKAKVDTWRAITERFKHEEIKDDFYETYKVISKVIKHEPGFFDEFWLTKKEKITEVVSSVKEMQVFLEMDETALQEMVYRLYPLHPVSAFVLVGLTNKIAQNERTLFSFLSADEKNTLPYFLKTAEGDFPLITPDYVYDYFEPLIKKEIYTSEIFRKFSAAQRILNQLEKNSLEAQIVKTITLINLVDRFDRLSPTAEVIINIFKEKVSDPREIATALSRLQEGYRVVYVRKSDGYLVLKNPAVAGSVKNEIVDMVEKVKGSYRVRDVLNEALSENYFYPVKHNNDKQIVRYFDFVFLEGKELLSCKDWEKKIADVRGSGVVYGIIPKDEDELAAVHDFLCLSRVKHKRIVFIVPREFYDIEAVAFEYKAVDILQKETADDLELKEEYDFYREDLEKAIKGFINIYFYPEHQKAYYYYCGEKKNIYTRAQFYDHLSRICDDIYKYTPIINNEVVNKDVISPVAFKSRTKVVKALLKDRLEFNLGLKGNGLEVFIMRTTLMNLGILHNEDGQTFLKLENIEEDNLQKVLELIKGFFISSSADNPKNFRELYDKLTSPDFGIGLKKGVIPIYIAAVLHFFRRYAVITKNGKELEITADLLNNINENPQEYWFYLEEWSESKERYILGLEAVFASYINELEKEYGNFSYILKGMQRWFVSLPLYAKKMEKIYMGEGKFVPVDKRHLKFVNEIRKPEINPREFLFGKTYKILGVHDTEPEKIIEEIRKIKDLLDNAKQDLAVKLTHDMRKIFAGQKQDKSLVSVLKDWHEGLDVYTQNHLFSSNEDRILKIIKEYEGDDELLTEMIAKNLVGLRIEEWNSETVISFLDAAKKFKEKVEEQDEKYKKKAVPCLKSRYKICFIDESGKEEVRIFNKTDYSQIGRLLYNEIISSLEDFGTSLSQDEKRQILVEILEKLC
ncbi:hypothetical protein [Thermosyntropha sp.]|uniref:hypothetical protein n=1 Tax=Thermosyntropha sp. TaxID=2740820 RepID=UPI0025D91E63|nr:hypothetical protein [Thermosyntropha sp.]MBO8159626.1 hypothetical protein [Thermosyntropha sp.]